MLINAINPFKKLFTDRSIPSDVIFFSVILILIPVVLITGPALPDIFLSLIALYFLIKSVWQKQWHYYKNKLVFGFLIFSSYIILRSFFSDMPIESLTNEGSMFYFRYIFFAMGVWYLLDHNPHLKRCLLIICILSLVLVCLDGLYQYFVEINLFGNEKHTNDRLTGFFNTEPILGRYIAYLSLFTFALMYQIFKKTKLMMTLSVSFLVMCEVIVFLTGERAPLFYVSLFTVLIVIFIPHYRLYRIVGVIASIIIIFSILQINPTAKSRIVDHTIQQVSETKIPGMPYSAHHEEHYITSLNMFKEHPIFGVGTNMFRFKCDNPQYKYKRGCISHPHNFYFQAIAELGIIGLLFLITFFLYLLFIGLKQFIFVLTNNKTKQIPFEFLLYPMILFIYWWPIIPHMSFYNNWNNVMMMLPLGFFMRYFYGNTNNGNY